MNKIVYPTIRLTKKCNHNIKMKLSSGKHAHLFIDGNKNPLTPKTCITSVSRLFALMKEGEFCFGPKANEPSTINVT
jgi:hypothetical protein